MANVKRYAVLGLLLVSPVVCGCGEPVEPSFFAGTWTPVYHGGGDMRIDIAEREVVTWLGVERPPCTLKIERITPIERGIRLTLRPLPLVEDQPADFTVDWEFSRIGPNKMRVTDGQGDSSVWARVEPSNTGGG